MTNPEHPASVQGSVWARVMFTQHVKTYFQNTSLHGLQYVGEDGRPFMEKVLWMILFLLGIILMVIFFIPGIIRLKLRLLRFFWFKEFTSFSTFQRVQVWTPEITPSAILTSPESPFVQTARSWRAASGLRWAPPSCHGPTSRPRWMRRPPQSSDTQSSTISQIWSYFLETQPG